MFSHRASRRVRSALSGAGALALVLAAASTAASSTSASPPTALPTQGLELAAGCPAAPVYNGSGVTTKFGTNVSTGGGVSFTTALGNLDKKFGKLDAVRVFDPALPPANAWTRRGASLANRSVISSFRLAPAKVLSGAYDSQILNYFKNTPARCSCSGATTTSPSRRSSRGSSPRTSTAGPGSGSPA